MPHVSKFFVLICCIVLMGKSVKSAMKKSWKPAANFDADIPKFTPFEHESADEQQNNEEYLPQPFSDESVSTQERFQEPSPSPTAESFTEESTPVKAPFRSKVKIGAKIPEAYNKQKHQFNKNSNDFGSFDADMKPESEIENESVQQDEPIDSLIDDFISANKDSVDVFPQNDDEEATVEDDNDQPEQPATKQTQPEKATVSHYQVGQAINLTVSEKDNTVNVKFDENALKEIMTGRGKKYGMMERILPLFILPFLIQSAVVPFIVTSIKLFLLKSVFAGKIAILLLLLGALKSHQNSLYMKSLHAAPYFAGPVLPERRFSGESIYDGYKAEGRPTSYIN